jgi:hypothetical protein
MEMDIGLEQHVIMEMKYVLTEHQAAEQAELQIVQVLLTVVLEEIIMKVQVVVMVDTQPEQHMIKILHKQDANMQLMDVQDTLGLVLETLVTIMDVVVMIQQAIISSKQEQEHHVVIKDLY